jgi:transcriptional regulator with XRE-family HTH domain
MRKSPPLSTYLRVRRDLVTPADVGIPSGQRRRVAGLRREEVAMLAGISPEYYLRLEQGRERRPSQQVLDGLAQALRLSADAGKYMRNLTQPAPRVIHRPSTAIDPGMRDLIDSWDTTPAYVQDHTMTVLGANAMARALSPAFQPGANLLKGLFLDEATRASVCNWEAITTVLVAWLRYLLAEDDSSAAATQSLIDELVATSPQFRTLWARHDVEQKLTGLVLFDHPRAGRLDLRYRTLVIPEQHQILVAYRAESNSATNLRLLANSLSHSESVKVTG